MSFKFDFWYWENVLSQKDRIYLNDYINKNYDKKELYLIFMFFEVTQISLIKLSKLLVCLVIFQNNFKP